MHVPLEATRSEQEIFDALEALCASPGYIHVLAGISVRDNYVTYFDQMTTRALEASYTSNRTLRTEFSTLLGLMVKHPIDFDVPSASEMKRLSEATTALLHELHGAFNQPMLARLRLGFEESRRGLSRDKSSPFIQGDTLREAIFYGGESAYSFQYRDFAVERYALDEEWLRVNKGFSIAESRSVTEAMGALGTEKLLGIISRAGKSKNLDRSLLPGFTFSLSEIAEAANVPPKVAEAVLTAFTIPEAPTNVGFKSIGDFNQVNACPVIRAPDGNYISLQSYGFVEALYDSPFYWMANDKRYLNTASTHRGAFTEEFVARRLEAVFGSANVHRGVKVLRKNDDVTDIDVLVLFADRAIVVQCKSKKLTLEARKGNDLKLREDFKKAVQHAYDQAHLCAKSLSNPDLKFVRGDGVEVTIPALREIYPICVVSDHYPALASQVREFLSFQTDSVIQAPLVGDVFLIDVLAEMLTSPLRLLSYVHRRVGYGDRLTSVNELSILGYHLQQNLWIEGEMGMVLIAEDFGLALDVAMTVRREGADGEATPKGILTRLKDTLLGRLIALIERSSDTTLIDLGFLLLSMDGDTLDVLDRGLAHVAAQTRRDGRGHDVTVVFKEGESGLTIHCSRLPNSEALAVLKDHCAQRKYASRANSWFGLVIREDDGMPKFGVQLSFPWKWDAKMEAETAAMRRTIAPQRGTPAYSGPKVGRNDPCPCGSGKKFKKCHLIGG